MSTVPAQVRDLIEKWQAQGCPAQPGIPWPRAGWVEEFPESGQRFRDLPGQLDRASVREACRQASESVEEARWAFLASMAWGYGRVGYGRWRTERALLDTPDAAERLHEVASCLAADGGSAAYRLLATTHRIGGLGPAFGTKFLYFCPQAVDARPALILDRIVADWLHFNKIERLNPVPWRPAAYDRYLGLMCGWADQLAVAPEVVEERVFVSSATGQWG